MFKMQANESVTSWFDWYITIVNQLNQLGRVIPEDEMVKRLFKSLPKSWKSTMVAIREAKDLNKISLDEFVVLFLFMSKKSTKLMKKKRRN